MKELELYGGSVKLKFNPNATRYRYTVTDRWYDRTDEPIRGVTTVLKDIIHKPDLMQWPMNMSHQFLFGQKFDDQSKEYIYQSDKAALQANTMYTEAQLESYMQDARKAHMKRSDRGKDVGSLAHRAIELYLQGEKNALRDAFGESDDEVSDDIKKPVTDAYNAFVEWWESLPSAEVVHLERPVYSRNLSYAGTIDILAKINGKTVLIDLKTSNSSSKAPMGIYSEYFVQLGGYSHALREETSSDIDELLVVRASKEGELNLAAANADMKLSVGDCERAFAFAVRLHDWLENASNYLTDRNFTSNFNQYIEGR